MSHEEYKKKLQEIEKKTADEIKLLNKEFAESNAKYKKGEKITGNVISILISGCEYNSMLNCFFYEGYEIDKNGKTTKMKKVINFDAARKYKK